MSRVPSVPRYQYSIPEIAKIVAAIHPDIDPGELSSRVSADCPRGYHALVGSFERQAANIRANAAKLARVGSRHNAYTKFIGPRQPFGARRG